MSLSIPFDYNPVDNKETNSSYTVPAGKYAIMSVTLSVSAFGRVLTSGGTGGFGTNNNSSPTVSSSSDSTTITLRLKSGEVVTKSENPASSSSSTSGTEIGPVVAQGTSNAAVLINGVEVSEIDCSAYAFGYDDNASSNENLAASVAGTAKVHWHIAEYNNAS